MSSWETTLLVAASMVAVMSLVRLMLRHRDMVLAHLQQEMAAVRKKRRGNADSAEDHPPKRRDQAA